MGLFLGLGFRLGTAPSQQQSIIGVLLRAIQNHIILTFSNCYWGGGQYPRFRVKGLGAVFVGALRELLVSEKGRLTWHVS